MYSVPIRSTGTIWSIPASCPLESVVVFALEPVIDPELTAIGLSDSTRTPIKASELFILSPGLIAIR